MSVHRRVRATLAAVAALGVVLTVSAPADAAPRQVSPPVVTFVPGPVAADGTASVTFTWTEATAGVTFSCTFDGAAVGCGSPSGRLFTGLAQGPHTFTVKASLQTYKPGQGSATYVAPDTTPPAPPTVSSVPPVTNNVLNPVRPTFSDSSSDWASWLCNLDGAGDKPCASGAQINASPDGYHSMTVKAVDTSGNISKPTFVSWIVKTTVKAPFIVTAPASPTSDATHAAFTFDDLESGVTFDCKLDAGSYAQCNGGSWSYSGSALSASALPGTKHTFSVRANDSYGNSTATTYSWFVTSAAVPTLAWANLPSFAGPVVNTRTAHFEFTTVNATGGVTCQLDSAAASPCTSPVDLTGIADGAHTFTVVASNGTGTTSLAYDWTVDATPPAAPAIYGPASLTRERSARVVIVPASLDDAFTCKLDNVATACGLATPVSASNLADGPHSVAVRVTDRAGNVTSASYAWTVDTTPPVATVTPPTAVDGAATVTLNENSTSAGSSPSLTLANGVPVATRRACFDVAGAAVDCGSAAVRTVKLFGASILVPGQGYVVQVNPAGAVPLTDVAGNPAATSSTAFRGPLTQQENSPATTQTWRVVKTTAAKGGSYVVEGRAGAYALWRFTGTGVTAYLAQGPTFGLAKVYVDGVLKATWNQYAAAQRFTSARSIRGLANAPHVVKIVVTGKKGARAAKGADVGIDAMSAGSLQRTPALTLRWARTYAKTASGHYRSLAGLPGETFSMTFVGTGVRWSHPVGPGFGIAVVLVDGVKKATVDSYAATAKEGVVWTSATLANGRHTIRVVTLGTKRAAAKGTAVGVDFLQAR